MDTSESNQPARVVGEKKEQRSNIPIGLMGSLHSHQQCSTQEGKKKENGLFTQQERGTNRVSHLGPLGTLYLSPLFFFLLKHIKTIEWALMILLSKLS